MYTLEHTRVKKAWQLIGAEINAFINLVCMMITTLALRWFPWFPSDEGEEMKGADWDREE